MGQKQWTTDTWSQNIYGLFSTDRVDLPQCYKFLLHTLSFSEGSMTETTMKLPIDFKRETPAFGIQCVNRLVIAPNPQNPWFFQIRWLSSQIRKLNGVQFFFKD